MFDHLVGLALKGLRIWKITSASDQPIFVQWERFEAEKVMACKSCQVCKSAENYTTWQNEKKIIIGAIVPRQKSQERYFQFARANKN